MRIVGAFEESPIPIDAKDLEVGGRTLMRQDVMRHGYVEWRASAPKGRDRNDPELVDIDRTLYARGVVGLLPLGAEIAVLVQPKFPASITHMVEACGWNPAPISILRNYRAIDNASDWMLSRLVQDFLGAVHDLLAQGLMRTYWTRQDATSSPKGRLLMGRTIARHASRGVDFRATVAYFTRSEENAPNQAILETLHWIQGWPGLQHYPKEVQRTISALRAFQYVPRDTERHFLEDPQVRGKREVPESRSAYLRALALALALLERRGFSLDAAEGTLALTSLLVETDRLFEAFVRLRLRDHLAGHILDVVDGNKFNPAIPLFTAVDTSCIETALGKSVPLLPGRGNRVSPDILVRRTDGSPALVIDVKYKAIKDAPGDEAAHADRSAIEQCVTYGVRLGCETVLSIHPTQEGQSSGLFASGRIGPVSVYQYRVNLAAQELEAEMASMARSLAVLVKATSSVKGLALP